MRSVHVHHQKILQNGYNNEDSYKFKILIMSVRKIGKWILRNTLFARIIIHQHSAEVYTIQASGMTHSKFILNKTMLTL
jgi:hypothetical protein